MGQKIEDFLINGGVCFVDILFHRHVVMTGGPSSLRSSKSRGLSLYFTTATNYYSMIDIKGGPP